MKILALVSDAYGGTGGIAQYNRDFLDALIVDGRATEVVVIPRAISRSLPGLPPGIRHFPRAAESNRAYFGTVVRVALERTSPGLVVCGHVNLLPVAWMASALSRAPLLLLTYGVEVWRGQHPYSAALMRRADAVVSISAFTLERLMSWSRVDQRRCRLLPNAVDLDRYTPGPRNGELARQLGLEGRRVLLTLGRMDSGERAKGFDEVMEALPMLVDRFPDLVYCAAGDGTDLPRLRAKADSLGLSEHVRFPGYVPDNDKVDLIRLADVYVMPSRLEGFGYVYLEALACGVPVVGSSADGSREALSDGRWGTLVDPDDRGSIVQAVSAALCDPRVPARAELEYFSKSRFATRTSAILDTVVGERRPVSS